MLSTLQSKLDEGKCPTPPAGTCPEGPEIQLEAVQTALRQRESEASVGPRGLSSAQGCAGLHCSSVEGQDAQMIRKGVRVYAYCVPL